jgi:putative oxidoreductase
MLIHLFATAGRTIIGLYFLLAGLSKITGPLPLPQIEHMVANGIPQAEFMFGLSGACELIAGVCLIIGLQVRLMAFLLSMFVLLVSVTLHAFWTMKEGDHETTIQMIMFMKNMATAGGLFAFIAVGAGPLSLDRFFGVED